MKMINRMCLLGEVDKALAALQYKCSFGARVAAEIRGRKGQNPKRNRSGAMLLLLTEISFSLRNRGYLGSNV